MRLQDVAVEAAQATPPVSVNAMLLFGVPLAHWVIILNFVYIGLLIVHKLYKVWKEKDDEQCHLDSAARRSGKDAAGDRD